MPDESKRPAGLPRKIIAWWWKALKAPGKVLRAKPKLFWEWRKWRLAPTSPAPQPKPKPRPFKPIEGVDYETGPSAVQLKAAGKRFVCRYLSTPGNPKNLRPAEAQALHKAGIAIVLVFETTGTTFLGGATAGRHDAALALQQAKALGVPASVPIYFAIDEDPNGHEALIVDYIKGAASVMTKARTGVYGGLAAINACHRSGVCSWFWQTLAWSNGLWSVVNHLEQYGAPITLDGHQVDPDRAVKASYGAWAAE